MRLQVPPNNTIEYMFTSKPVFTPLYEEMDRVLASNEKDALDNLPMWLVLLFVAEPAAMRRYRATDLEEAKVALAWACSFWNIGRRRPRRRERAFELDEPKLARWLNSKGGAREMVLRASLWRDDRRVVAHAAIKVEPDAWRLDIVLV
jgi:hypothetical protein